MVIIVILTVENKKRRTEKKISSHSDVFKPVREWIYAVARYSIFCVLQKLAKFITCLQVDGVAISTILNTNLGNVEAGMNE